MLYIPSILAEIETRDLTTRFITGITIRRRIQQINPTDPVYYAIALLLNGLETNKRLICVDWYSQKRIALHP